MTAVDPNVLDADRGEARRAAWFTRINKADGYLKVLGLAWITPILRAIAGDNPRGQLTEIWRLLGIPLTAIACFLTLWAVLAPQVQTSLGAVPGPAQVWQEARVLHADAVRKGEQRATFEERLA